MLFYSKYNPNHVKIRFCKGMCHTSSATIRARQRIWVYEEVIRSVTFIVNVDRLEPYPSICTTIHTTISQWKPQTTSFNGNIYLFFLLAERNGTPNTVLTQHKQLTHIIAGGSRPHTHRTCIGSWVYCTNTPSRGNEWNCTSYSLRFPATVKPFRSYLM